MLRYIMRRCGSTIELISEAGKESMFERIRDWVHGHLSVFSSHSNADDCHINIGRERIIYIGLIMVVVGVILFTAMDFRPFMRFHCANFVLNTYLYFILALLLVGLIMLHLHVRYKCEDLEASGRGFNNNLAVLLAFVSIAVIAAIVILPRDYFWMHHVLFFAMLGMIGFALFPLFDAYEHEVRKSIYVSIAAMFAMAVLHTIKPDLPYDKSWGTWLIALASGGMLSELIDQFTHDVFKRPEHTIIERILHILLTTVAVLLIYIDSKTIALHAAVCSEAAVPNYVRESLHYVLDFFKLVLAV
jgi:hypothetical protein